MKIRPRSEDSLLEVLPFEPAQTIDQRRTALSSALIRLRVKRLIQQEGETWRAA